MSKKFSHLGVASEQPKDLQCIGQSIHDGQTCIVYRVEPKHYAWMIINTPNIIFSEARLSGLRDIYVKAR